MSYVNYRILIFTKYDSHKKKVLLFCQFQKIFVGNIRTSKYEVLFLFCDLKKQGSHSSLFTLFFHEDFEILVDDCYSQQDTSTRSNGTHEIGQD